MRKLVRLRLRPSRDGGSFVYFLDYLDEDGKRQRITLGHANKRKAERQRDQKERELRMGIVAPSSMRLSVFTMGCTSSDITEIMNTKTGRPAGSASCARDPKARANRG